MIVTVSADIDSVCRSSPLENDRTVCSPLKSARAVASHRRKSTPFRSAMSMLNFEINRGGTNLTAERLCVLQRAKDELRKLYGRPVAKKAAPRKPSPGHAAARARKRPAATGVGPH